MLSIDFKLQFTVGKKETKKAFYVTIINFIKMENK